MRNSTILRKIASRLSSIVGAFALLMSAATVSSCVIDYGDSDYTSRRMSSASHSLFDRYARLPLEYMKNALLLDRYLSLPEDEKASAEYDFIRNGYTVEGDVHTVFGTSFTIKGGSLWDKGAVWGSDLGMTITRAEADSTWTLALEGDRLSLFSMEVRMVSPMTVSRVELKTTLSGDYTSDEIKAHFSAKDFGCKWERDVQYSYVNMDTFFNGLFEILFYDGPVQRDWAQLLFPDSPFAEYSSSRKETFYRE
ncbi:MAG: hypothetical protein IJV54_02045 [Bacteroidales bacterium]|nr:hypothetical protein [Bacteroidales bacterium]